jgi:hypothetical protein
MQGAQKQGKDEPKPAVAQPEATVEKAAEKTVASTHVDKQEPEAVKEKEAPATKKEESHEKKSDSPAALPAASSTGKSDAAATSKDSSPSPIGQPSAAAQPQSPQAVPSASPAPNAKAVGKIKILDFPENIKIEEGEKVTMQVIVKNMGDAALHEVRLLISGLPSSSYAITPEVESIEAGKNVPFTIEFNGAGGAKQHSFKFILSSSDDTQEALSILTVTEKGGDSKK